MEVKTKSHIMLEQGGTSPLEAPHTYGVNQNNTLNYPQSNQDLKDVTEYSG